MKKIIITIAMLSIFSLYGCGTAAKQSEFWEHSTMYKNCDHMKFSIWGYKNPTDETFKRSHEQGWWGIPIESK